MSVGHALESACLPGFESVEPPAAKPATRPQRSWLAVASADHVRLGQAQGFMQVCHGKAGPLKRLRPGDRVAYYSPSTEFGGKDRLQCFTALGEVLPREPYVFDIGGGFTPWRRDVAWQTSQHCPIRPLLERLEFTRGQKNWAYQLRFGLLQISGLDMALIAQAMGAQTYEVLGSGSC